MSSQRLFRFGVQASRANSGADWKEQARKVEALGYDILLMPDHLGEQLAIGPALAIAADATTNLRIGTLVLQNDLRHPAFVAKEAATLDLLSDGRFELGLGAGGSWMPDYERTGIPFDRPGARVGRLMESLRIISGLWSDSPVSHAGDHYTITSFEGFPKPVQRPRPPILVAGGGPRALTFAAQEADIVAVLPRLLPVGGHFQMEQCRAEAFEEQIDLVRQTAGPRIAELELNVLLQRLVVSDDAGPASDELSREWEPLTPAQVLESPYLLIGSIEGIVESLQARRERFGVSYVVVFDHAAEAFAPVIARLMGT